jgi:hypothetical protein
LPLNGSAEDSCIFARRRVDKPGMPPGAILYDLERRDEGAFTRLKFLLEAASSTGMIVGLSLFDAAPESGGPFSASANLQGVSLNEAAPRQTERLLDILNQAVDWICSAARGFQGVWIEVFRNAHGEPSTKERSLCARVAQTFSRYREDLSPERLGPWVAVRNTQLLSEKHSALAAPFDPSLTIPGDARASFSDELLNAASASGTRNAQPLFLRAPERQPALLRLPESALTGRHEVLWRAFFQGYWPVVAMRLTSSRDTALWDTLASLARFSVAWAGRAALRSVIDLLDPIHSTSAFAAEDGAGRYFIYFNAPILEGLTLSLPPGFYRYYWISPSAARVIDRGDGVEGVPHAHIPGSGYPEATLLAIEENEAPDSLAVW